jgi:hypothetical protein
MERVDAFGKKVPDAGPSLTRLATLFTAERYGKQETGEPDLRVTAAEWQQLQPTLWKKWASELLRRSE